LSIRGVSGQAEKTRESLLRVWELLYLPRKLKRIKDPDYHMICMLFFKLFSQPHDYRNGRHVDMGLLWELVNVSFKLKKNYENVVIK